MELNELNLTEEQLAAVQKIIQSETDKVRTKYSQDLKAANDELTKYKPKEKTAEEIALEERVKALENREREISAKEKTLNIANKLSSKGLPKELAQYLDFSDDSKVDEVIGAVSNFFLGNSNIPTEHAHNKGVTKQQFKAMSYTEKAKLFKENPELYKMLSR